MRKILKWAGIIFVVLMVVFFGWRVVVVWGKRNTDEQVAKIHATKLRLADVIGERLPPTPENPDATVVGVDANKNGIRDDVELAIFSAYPNSARTRAVLLQYALALQMEVTQPIVNEGTVNAVIEKDSRAGTCIADTLVPRKTPESHRTYSDIEKIDAYTDFVDKKQFNTVNRENTKDEFYKNLTGSDVSDDDICDIDLDLLPN